MQIDRVSAFSAGDIAPVLSNKRYLVSNAIYFRSRELKNDTFESNSSKISLKAESLSDVRFDRIISERVKNISPSNRTELISELAEVLAINKHT